MGDSTEHPRASSINIRDYISFRQTSLSPDSSANEVGHIGTDHSTGIVLSSNGANNVIISAGGTVRLKSAGGADPSGIAVYNSHIYADSDFTFKGAIHPTPSYTAYSTEIVYQTNPVDRRRAKFVNGILVSDVDN